MNTTGIEWADFTSNPIRYRDAAGYDVWACVKCSDGCKNCYAETLAKRYGKGGPFCLQVTRNVTLYFCDKTARKLLKSKKLAGKRVFIGDMTDVFGEWVPFDLLDRLFAVFALRPDVTFQVLTKRPARATEYLTWRNTDDADDDRVYRIYSAMSDTATPRMHPDDRRMAFKDLSSRGGDCWPLPNVWIGTSVENQKAADDRIPHLLECPAAVRFLSIEPLIGPVDLSAFFGGQYVGLPGDVVHQNYNFGIDWIIVGGESGPGARPCNVAWIRAIIRQCKAAGIACFVKQLGARVVHEHANRGNGVPDAVYHPHGYNHENIAYHAGWLHLRDRKGGDPSEWPADLRVREFPKGGGR